MRSEFVLRYEHSATDDFGWLEGEVRTEGFWGRAGMWVQWQDVEEFAASLSAYPIPADPPLERAWGFNQLEGDDLIVGIRIRPSGRKGKLLVTL